MLNSDFLIIVFSRIFQAIITIIALRFMTRLLSPEEVGNYYLIMSIIAFFNLVFLNPPGMYFSRHLLIWYKSKNLLNALAVFITWMTFIALISIPILIFVFFKLGYAEKFQFWQFALFITSAIIISTTHRNLLHGANNLGYRKEFAVYAVCTLLLGALFSIMFVCWLKATSLYWLYGIILSELLILYPLFKCFISDHCLNLLSIKKTLSKTKIHQIFFFSFPICITTLLMWGQSMSYRFIVDYRYSAEILGYLAVGLGIASSISSTLEAILSQYFNPIFLKKIHGATKDERTIAWIDMASVAIPVYLLGMIFIISMAQYLNFLLVDPKFHGAYVYVTIGAIIEFCRILTGLLGLVSYSEHQNSYTIKPYLIGFSITMISLLSFDFKNQLYMIPLILLLSTLVTLLLLFINMRKLLFIKINFSFLKTALLALPFFSIIFLPKSFHPIVVVTYLFIFGGYYLLASWWITRHNSFSRVT